MNGISPRSRLLTPTETQISSAVVKAMPELPLVLTDLIAQYAFEDFSKATAPFIFDDEYNLADCVENADILTTIKKALVSPACDPAIKEGIFKKMAEASSTYPKNLNAMFDEIRKNGDQINLNNVNFSELNLMMLNLADASITGARFNICNLHFVNLKNADLTGSDFEHSEFLHSDLSGANLTRADFNDTIFSHTDMVKTNLTKAVLLNARFECAVADGMITDDDVLQGIIEQSSFNPEKFCDEVDVNTFIAVRLVLLPKPHPKAITILNGRYSSTGEHTMYTPCYSFEDCL